MLLKTVTVKQIQALDKMAIERCGVSSIVLMENAGRAVAHEVMKRIKSIKKPFVCVVCGLGNNAGDGYVAARHLINAGVGVKIFQIGRCGRLKHDAAVNCRILQKLKYPIEVGTGLDLSLRDMARADVVVDAIFGVGLNRQVLEPFKGVIEAMNQNARYIVSVDIPSGLDGTTGRIYGVCVRAGTTATFSFAKKGFYKNQGPQYIGKVVVADIGIPLWLKKRI